MSTQPRAILVFRSAGLGDFIMSAPAFHALRRRFPRSRIILLTMHSATPDIAGKVALYAGGADKAPWASLLVPHLIDDVVAITPPRSLATLRTARQALRGREIDLAIPMIDVGTTWLRRLKKMLYLGLLIGPVRQIGWRSRGTIAHNRRARHDPSVGHHVHGPLQFLRELDGDAAYSDADVVFDLRPDDDAWNWAQDYRSRLDSDVVLVAITPGAAQHHKDWPLEKYMVLARELLAQDERIHIVIAGSGAEVEKADRLVVIDPARMSSVCGCTSIARSAALFAHCKLVVGNDGGAVHLADAMGAKVVSIVPGLEFPDSIEPWHNRHRAVRHPVPCAPCYSFSFCPEGHNRCMLNLPLDRVLAACREALAEI